MILGVLAAFAAAGAAPLLARAAGRRTGWLLAAVPLGICGHLWRLSGAAAGNGAVPEFAPWLPDAGLNLSFRADGLSLLFGLVITLVGAPVLAYSEDYLADKPQRGRFYAFLLAFMGSMLGLVFSDNLLLTFVFWELTSVCSYFLIGFRHEREEARAAALQALVVTGAGGLALLAGALLLGEAGGTFELSALASRGSLEGHPRYAAILALILAGAFTKSAQFPFHFWLPNAMEAPAPASAYLHAATMVKAGVFLLARLNPVLGGTSAWRWSLIGFGTATMTVGAWRSLRETDLKRVLAFSTVSALGTLVCLLGLGTRPALIAWVWFFLGHALYKGALFLVAGAVEHETGERDSRSLGGLRTAMPFTAAAALLATASMAALPPSLGFLGKEALYGAFLAAPRRWWLLTPAAASNMLLFAAALSAGARPFLGKAAPTPRLAREAAPGMWIGPLLLALLGLALPFSSVTSALASAAVSAITGLPFEAVELSLWHGFSPELALSAATIVGGFACFAAARKIRGLGGGRAAPSLEGAYALSLAALFAAARAQTRVLQSGYLRSYLLIVLIATIMLVGAGVARGPLPSFDASSGVKPWEAAAAALVALSALAAAGTRSSMVAIASMGAAGYGVALLYIFFGAPDLAMTQFIVESLTIVLFLLVFRRLPKLVGVSSSLSRGRDAFVALSMGALMTALVLAAFDARTAHRISGWFGEHSVPLAHGRNVVNVIIVDFRAFDTLGEITVLALAAAGVYALLKPREAAEKT